MDDVYAFTGKLRKKIEAVLSKKDFSSEAVKGLVSDSANAIAYLQSLDREVATLRNENIHLRNEVAFLYKFTDRSITPNTKFDFIGGDK